VSESNQPLKPELESTFKDIAVTDGGDGRLTVVASPGQVLTVLTLLRDRGFDHLALVSAVDRIQEEKFEVVYILSSYAEGSGAAPDGGQRLLIVKTSIPRGEPHLRSAIGVFPNAEPYERETHELFGIHFAGHPRLTPLFLERKYSTPPFRKDFDTRKYVEDVFDSIPFVGEEDK
jgi:NADH-quinone oxidoreductase subunit C